MHHAAVLESVGRIATQHRHSSLFSAEFDFLTRCCSSRGSAGRREFAGATDIDWERLIRLADHHGLIPRVHEAVSAAPDAMPSHCFEELRRHSLDKARRALSLTSELVRIVEHVESCGVEVLPYKGPILAQSLYGNVTLRQYGDLDLLVRVRDVARAKAALVELGYKTKLELSPQQERAYLQSGYEYTFDSAYGRNAVELQWRILPRFYAISFDVEGFFRRAVSMDLGGRKFRSLCPEDLFLVLCVHAAKHAWAQVSWLCDIVELAYSQSIDWDLVEANASQLGIERIVAITGWLARELLGRTLPVEGKWRDDPDARSIARAILPTIVEGEHCDPAPASHFAMMIRARGRWRDRAQLLSRLAFTPTAGDWSAMRLPAALFPLYRVVRLARLAHKLFQGKLFC